jgi:VWFA-related protein
MRSMAQERKPLYFVAAFFLGIFPSFAQEQRTFRTVVSLVRVDAAVTDGTRTLTNLGKEDFRIWDNGQPQSILYFAGDEEPLDLILLFDISRSMRPNVQKVAASARMGLSELRPGDRVTVMVFNRKSRIVAPFSSNLEDVERAVQSVLGLKFGGGTHILAAVNDAALILLREPKRGCRRAVLIITDNYGLRTRSEKTVVRHLWEADALLSGLIVRNPGFAALHRYSSILAPQTRIMEQGMTGVAEKTGGETLTSDNPGPAFREMLHSIRHRYSLYYVMPRGKPAIQQFSPGLVVVRISGSDVGEFGDAPLLELNECLTGDGTFELFIDAREVRGASVDVSSEWAEWLRAHKPQLREITMLTGSRFVQMTADFVRRFADLEGIMRVHTEPAVFDAALAESLDRH